MDGENQNQQQQQNQNEQQNAEPNVFDGLKAALLSLNAEQRAEIFDILHGAHPDQQEKVAEPTDEKK